MSTALRLRNSCLKERELGPLKTEFDCWKRMSNLERALKSPIKLPLCWQGSRDSGLRRWSAAAGQHRGRMRSHAHWHQCKAGSGSSAHKTEIWVSTEHCSTNFSKGKYLKLWSCRTCTCVEQPTKCGMDFTDLLTTGIWQKWQDATSKIRLQKDSGYSPGYGPLFLSLSFSWEVSCQWTWKQSLWSDCRPVDNSTAAS